MPDKKNQPFYKNVIDITTGKPIKGKPLPTVCRVIRRERESLGMEQKELAEKIGVTANAVSNWERGRCRPDVNLLPDICKALHITLYELYDIDDPTIKYTADEQMLVASYQPLTKGHKRAVNNLIDTLSNVEQIEQTPDIRHLMLYERSLAAGIGDPTEFENNYRTIYAYASPEIDKADCVFTVNGNSMEPEYHDGDMVLVKQAEDGQSIAFGDIGAFIVGNETYIKRFEADGLHSLNPDYPTMTFSDDMSVFSIGKVIGILNPKWLASADDVERYKALCQN